MAFELLDFLVSNAPRAKHDLAQSNLPAFPLDKLGFPEDLDLSWAYASGSPELRNAVARASGVNEEQVIVTQGASEANFLVGMALLESGSRVLVERPYYEPLWKSFLVAGAQVSFLPRPFEDGFAISIDRMSRSMPEDTRLVVFTNLYNPGGVAIERRMLVDLAALAEDRGFYILVDEVFREAAFEKAPPCAATLSERVIVTSSPSKFYGLGGLRIGWCVASEEILGRIKGVKNFTTVAPSIVSDALALKALKAREEIVRRNRELIGRNRRLTEEWIEAQPRIEWVPPLGYVSFPWFHGDVDRLASVALDGWGTLIAPGRFFGEDDHFRLCFGMETPKLEAGLAGLDRALKAV